MPRPATQRRPSCTLSSALPCDVKLTHGTSFGHIATWLLPLKWGNDSKIKWRYSASSLLGRATSVAPLMEVRCSRKRRLCKQATSALAPHCHAALLLHAECIHTYTSAALQCACCPINRMLHSCPTPMIAVMMLRHLADTVLVQRVKPAHCMAMSLGTYPSMRASFALLHAWFV